MHRHTCCVGDDLMLYLLQLDEQGQSRHVPVAERTAGALERALLAPDVAARQPWLAEAIASDPALAVWAAHAAQQYDAGEPTTAAALGAWLSDQLVVKLMEGGVANPAKLSAPAPRDSDPLPTAALPSLDRAASSDADRYAAACANVVVRARAAHAEAGTSVRPTEDESYMREMLAWADQLMAAWPMQVRTAEPLLPTFPTSMLPQSSTSVTPDETVDALTAYFLAQEPDIAWRLPALVALLADHERKLAAFNDRLEHEKLESLKELAYGASHEINNPLANIAARAQMLLREETDPERQRKLAAIHRQAMRAHEMIADLMLFARPPKLQPTTCDLRDVARRVVGELAETAQERRIELRCDAAEDAIVLEGDATQLAVAIQAVVTNSLEAVGIGGHVDVAVRRTAVGGHEWVEVVVQDDGPGISDQVRQHMFDPFYSGREAGRGLGFGLSKCWRIVTDHGGQIIVGKSARRGAQLSILLPAAHQAAIDL